MSFRCQRCDMNFSRSEHLTRHIRTHTNDKPHICPVCKKGFSRSDVLSRHYNSHQGRNPKDAEDGRGSSFRACLLCAAARVKCCGPPPCQRCSTKGLECHQSVQSERRGPAKRASRRKAQTGDGDLSAAQITSKSLYSIDQSEMQAEPTDLQSISPDGYPIQNTPSRAIESPPLSTQVLEDMHQQGSTVNPEYQGTFNGFDSCFGVFPEVVPGPFPMMGSQPNVDLGYSAVNWLSPNDLSYDEFITSAQYSVLPDYIQNAPAQQFEVQDAAMTGQPLRAMASPAISSFSPQHISMSLETPQRDGNILPEISDSPISSSTQSKTSNYYADGANTREARYGRLRRHRSLLDNDGSIRIHLQTIGARNRDIFPFAIEEQITATNISSNFDVPLQSYATLQNEFQNFCLRFPEHLNATYFPSIAVFDLSMHLYFEYFHPTFPLLHKPWKKVVESWITVLATAAIGIGYLGTKEANRCAESLLDFLHWSLQNLEPTAKMSEKRLGTEIEGEELAIIQSTILCTAGMFHSRDAFLVEKAQVLRSKLVTLCLRRKMLHKDSTQRKSTFPSWKDWSHGEAILRAGYCIWLLDCIMAYQSDYRPQLRLDDAKILLPCGEEIWEAPEEQVWRERYSSHEDPPSLIYALEALYKRRLAVTSIGEFAKILIIHGLYHRTWEVARYQADALSNWIPSAPGTRIPSPDIPSDGWLPRDPVYSKWRNSACDCLDTLHWTANSQIAQKAGVEHPTVLHLHLARLILLTPIRTIQQVASTVLFHFANGRLPLDSSVSQYQNERSEILRWFIQDQYKARLAIIHAGAIFWHVRRYSYDSMLEPYAILVSTLIMWAYSTTSQVVTQQQQNAQERDPQSQRSELDGAEGQTGNLKEATDRPFINIDRLSDDELIQMYALEGANMTGYLFGIGDFCKEGNSPKILLEGAKIIATSGAHRTELKTSAETENSTGFPTWGIASKHAIFLEDLANATGRGLS